MSEPDSCFKFCSREDHFTMELFVVKVRTTASVVRLGCETFKRVLCSI